MKFRLHLTFYLSAFPLAIFRHYGSPPNTTHATRYVVAASNSTVAEKAGADYTCTGTNDQTTINNAINNLIDWVNGLEDLRR